MVIFDGKGDLEFFQELLPHIHRAGRLDDLRLINPARPELSSLYNPFYTEDDDFMAQGRFSFLMSRRRLARGHDRRVRPAQPGLACGAPQETIRYPRCPDPHRPKLASMTSRTQVVGPDHAGRTITVSTGLERKP